MKSTPPKVETVKAKIVTAKTPAAPRKKRTNGSHSDGLPSVQIDRTVIARRAWEIWQSEGCPEGREVEHWLQAERELSANLSL